MINIFDNEKMILLDYWKLFCGILILLSIVVTRVINPIWAWVYLGLGGGGTVLIAEFFIKKSLIGGKK